MIALRVHSDEAPAAILERSLSLRTHPARPGHVLVSVEVALDDQLRASINAVAQECGLPAVLVATTSVEATHRVAAVAELTGAALSDVTALLDHASQARAPALLAPPARRLAQYARAIRIGSAFVALCSGTPRLPVPATIACGWIAAAAETRETTAQWATRQLGDSRLRKAIAWELAAADGGATLSEWVYAAALRALASMSPHERR